MGKKRKRLLETKGFDFTDKPNSVFEKIQNEVRLMNKSTDLIFGTNAVLRELEKRSLSIVLLDCDKASSAIYHALKLWCKKSDVLFMPLKTDSELLRNKKQLPSTTSGVKKSALSMHQKLSDLLTKINFRQKCFKNPEQDKTCSKMDNKSSLKDKNALELDVSEPDSNINEDELRMDYYHSKCSSQRRTLENENFLLLETNLVPNVDFLNYEKQSKAKFCIHVK